jgi:ribosomal protein L31E
MISVLAACPNRVCDANFFMSPKRYSAGVIFLIVLISPLVLAKESDGPIIAKVTRKAWETGRESIPNQIKRAAPLAAFRAGDALPVEERVRLRIETDRQMKGIRVEVWPGEQEGTVKLRGIVPGLEWKTRAGEIARSTIGVEQVINELAMTEAK